MCVRLEDETEILMKCSGLRSDDSGTGRIPSGRSISQKTLKPICPEPPQLNPIPQNHTSRSHKSTPCRNPNLSVPLSFFRRGYGRGLRGATLVRSPGERKRVERKGLGFLSLSLFLSAGLWAGEVPLPARSPSLSLTLLAFISSSS